MVNYISLIHGIDYVLTFSLIGFMIFYYFILPSGGSTAVELFSDWKKRFRFLLAGAFLSSTFWMILVSQEMAESWKASEMWVAMTMTHFGHIWCMKIISLALLFSFVNLLKNNNFGKFLAIAFALLLTLCSALTGHAFSIEEHQTLRFLADTVHLFAVGIWSGGLIALFIWLRRRIQTLEVSSDISFQVVTRFSHFAMVATGGILLSGTLMAYISGIDFTHPIKTHYGQLVATKLLIYFFTLGIAGINHLAHLRNGRATEEKIFARKIQREIGFEILLVICVFIVAGFLSRATLPMQ